MLFRAATAVVAALLPSLDLASVAGSHPRTPCPDAGRSCCNEAPSKCPEDSPGKCRAEQREGIINGPECRKEYAYTHCLHGQQLRCLYVEGCDCGTGRAAEELQRPAGKNASRGECSAAGDACCDSVPGQCPYPEAAAACQAELSRSVRNGPECRKDYMHSHCLHGHILDCAVKENCDCPSGLGLQRAYESQPAMLEPWRFAQPGGVPPAAVVAALLCGGVVALLLWTSSGHWHGGTVPSHSCGNDPEQVPLM